MEQGDVPSEGRAPQALQGWGMPGLSGLLGSQVLQWHGHHADVVTSTPSLHHANKV